LRRVVGIDHEDPPTTSEAGMTSRAIPTMWCLSTAVLLFAALYFARAILAPVAFSLRHLFFRKEK
jgi:hypothetical protein